MDVRILCTGCDTASLVAASELEKLGLKVRFCGSPQEDSVDLIDHHTVILGFINQNPAAHRNKYLKMTSLHINSTLASDFQLRWDKSISPGTKLYKSLF